MQSVIAGLSPVSYQRHALHDASRDWPETNCYVDLWIEVLHARGLEPRAGLGFSAGIDFEGDQFTFFKFPQKDLEDLFGAQVLELSIYDNVEAHICEQISRGRLAMVEVDAFYLPDTRGISHGIEHSKTTIGINSLDSESRRLTYFHNAGFFDLEAEDFDGVFQRSRLPGPGCDNLFPYAEYVKFHDASLEGAALKAAARRLLEAHVRSAPLRNPVKAFAERVETHAAQIAARDPVFFHKYAFNTLRQIGASFELLAAHLDWLDVEEFSPSISASRALSASAKAFQFQLARAVARKRPAGLAALLEPMAEHWESAIGQLRARLR